MSTSGTGAPSGASRAEQALLQVSFRLAARGEDGGGDGGNDHGEEQHRKRSRSKQRDVDTHVELGTTRAGKTEMARAAWRRRCICGARAALLQVGSALSSPGAW